MKIARLAAVVLLISCTSLPPTPSLQAPVARPVSGPETGSKTSPRTAPPRVALIDRAVATIHPQGQTDSIRMLVQIRRPPSFRTQQLELERIRRLRAWVRGSGIGTEGSDRIWNSNEYVETNPDAQTSLQILEVPRGSFRIVTLQGYDVSGQSYPEVPGATLKAVYDSPADSHEVTLVFNWRSSLEAGIIEAMLTQAQTSPELMPLLENLDRDALDVLLDRLTYGTSPPEGSSFVLHPTRLDPAAIAAAILAAEGEIPSYQTGEPIPTGWLEPMADLALVVRTPQQLAFSNSSIEVRLTDPASEPIVIATGSDTASLPQIIPGSWDAIVHIEGLNGGVSTRASVQVDANGQVSLTEGTEANPIILPPVIKSISAAAAVSGSQITLGGDGFDAATAANNIVKFGNVSATVLLATATSLLVEVPAGISGTLPVTVTSNSKTSNHADFSVTRAITGTSDPGAHTGESLSLDLSGYDPTLDEDLTVNFCADAGCTSTVPATITGTTASSVTVTVPAGAHTGPITVTPGSSDPLQSPSVYIDEPHIASFGPASGGAGSEITLLGVNLDDVSLVSIGGVTVPPANITVVDDRTLKIIVPAGALSGPISVSNPGGSDSSDSDFTMTLAITSLSSLSGVPGSSLTINVAGFNPQTAPPTVVFSGNVPATITASTATSLTVTVPAGAQSGAITVTPQGHDPLLSPDFTVVAPAITGLSSPGGFTGNSVTLNVTGFDPLTTSPTVAFCANTLCSSTINATVTGTSDSSITVTVPTGAVSGPIRVTPQDIATLQSPIYYVDEPVITKITNSSGQVITEAAKGQQIIITGINLATTTVVCFGTTCTTNFTRSGDVITLAVPNNITEGPIKILTLQGFATASFNLITAPVITSLTPPEVNQQALTIQGAHYLSVTQVTVGGQVLAPESYEILNDGSIQLNDLPDNPVLGTVTVTNPAGTAIASLTYKKLINYIGNSGGAPRTTAHFSFCSPHGINVDSVGNIYVADIGCAGYGYYNSIHKFTSTGTWQWTTGLNSIGFPGLTDGPIASALMRSPEDMASDSAGNLYVADTGNGAIRKITPAGQVVTLARLPGPEGIEITTDGKLYVTGNYPDNPGTLLPSNLAYVLRIDDLNTIPANLATLPYNPNDPVETNRWSSNVTKIAGGNISVGSANETVSPIADARFAHLEGLGIDGQNRIYIADVENYQIRRIDPANNQVTVFASMSSATPSTSSPTVYVHEIRVDRAGNVFIPSPSVSPALGVYLITPEGKISLIAGTGTSGLMDGDPLKEATFVSPRGIDFGPDGTLYIADIGWGVRKIERFHPAYNLQMP